jgi:hypothetical protein
VVEVELVALVGLDLEVAVVVALVEQELLLVFLFVAQLLILYKLEEVEQVREMALLLI